MQLRPNQFSPLKTKKTIEDNGHKIPLFEYEEPGHSNQFALMEASLFGDKGQIFVRLHNNVQYTYFNSELVVKIGMYAYKGMFNAALGSFDIAYVTEETFNKYLQEIKNPSFKVKSYDRFGHPVWTN